MYGIIGAVQDFRYYQGIALSASEINIIAENTFVNGKNLRTCEKSEEGQDQTFADINGNDCAWYQVRSCVIIVHLETHFIST